MAVLFTYIAAALLAWGITSAPAITAEFHSNPAAPIAQAGAGLPPDGHCLIGVFDGWWASASEADRQSVMTHEMGHCLGLGHYGDCNSIPSIMGCAFLGEITDYDRVMLARARGSGYAVVVPMLANR